MARYLPSKDSAEKTLYFLVSQRNIELKTGKHEFTDISDQNKQGFEGKKLSGTELTAIEENLCQTLPTRGIEGKESYCFITSIFAFVLIVILQNPSFVDISFHSMQKHPKYFSLRTAIFLHF